MEARELTKFVTEKAIALIKLLHNPSIGATEFSGGWCPERCDAILFCARNSYLIETKISRSDFLADFKKPHRQHGCGIGNYRYYACPDGLIKPEELPPKWGLIYVSDKKHRRATMPVGFGGSFRTPNKDYKHPEHGWTVTTYQTIGTPLPEHISTDEKGWWKHPDMPKNHFRFDKSDYERNFLFALAKRYKNNEFMENIL